MKGEQINVTYKGDCRDQLSNADAQLGQLSAEPALLSKQNAYGTPILYHLLSAI